MSLVRKIKVFDEVKRNFIPESWKRNLGETVKMKTVEVPFN